MEKVKNKRGYKGKIVLCDLYLFRPKEVVRAYEIDNQLYLELDDGDAMISDYVTVCDTKEEAWGLYAAHIEKISGIKLVQKCEL